MQRRSLLRGPGGTIRVVLLAGCCLTAVATSGGPAEAAAAAADVASEWQTITPGADTICSNGTPYAFYAREGNPDKLLVHLQGGGACWFPANCDLEARPTYDPFTNEQDHPAGRSGIFDLTNERNPVADFSMLFVTYCTADVHLGDKTVTYATQAEDGTTRTVEIHHKGGVNGRAALQWAFENVEQPRQILVTGSSAGAIAAPFYAGLLADHYPDARLAVLADAAGGYRTPKIAGLLDTWGAVDMAKRLPRYADVHPAIMDFETFFEVEGARLSEAVFTQYNTHGDTVQLQFLELLGVTGTPLIELIDANHADMREDIENLRVFTEEGMFHTILSRPELYTSEAGGVSLLDWMSDLVEGKPVEDARCDC